MPLLAELQRRRVFRALIGYAVVSFAVLQIIEPIMHGLHWPDSVLSYIVVALAMGFPLVVTLAWIFDVKAGRIERTAQMPVPGGWSGLPLALLLVGIGVLAAAPGAIYYLVLRNARSQGQSSPAAAVESSIAVLPFVNLSGGKDNDYFSDGVTEELINAVANIEGLRVASRTAVFALKESKLGIRQLGQELNVDTLLEGSVRREGNVLRVTAQLIKASDGYHLWSKTYQRELNGIFALEDEIARSIAEALRGKLVRGKAVERSTTNLEAHDLYLKGRFFWNKRTAEGFSKAVGYFEQAIQLDPGYALAHAGLADVLVLRLSYAMVLPSELAPKAKAAALRALEIDPGLAEAHASLGNIAWRDYDWATAEKEFRTAIELKPDYASAHQWYAETLVNLGRADEAKVEIGRALQADPTSMIINLSAGNILYLFERDYGRAMERLKKTLEMDPGFEFGRVTLAFLYAWQGRHAEALAEIDKFRLSTATFDLANRALLYAMAGRTVEARRLLRDLEQRSRREYVSSVARALVWAELGDKDRAFALLDQGCALHDPWLVDWGVRVDPSFDPLRSDPRFKRLLKCVHLD